MLDIHYPLNALSSKISRLKILEVGYITCIKDDSKCCNHIHSSLLSWHCYINHSLPFCTSSKKRCEGKSWTILFSNILFQAQILCIFIALVPRVHDKFEFYSHLFGYHTISNGCMPILQRSFILKSIHRISFEININLQNGSTMVDKGL